MLFDKRVDMFKVISVLELSWETERRTAKPRNFHALSFRIKGDANFEYKNNNVHVKSGDIAYVPKNMGYVLDHGSEHVIVVHFETNHDDSNQEFFSFTPHNIQIYKNLFEEMLVSWDSAERGCNYAVTSTFYSVLDKIHREAFSEYIPLSDERMRDVFDYIHKNYCDDINIPELAEIYGSSETYFRRVFKMVCGDTPLKYINSLKLRYAEELLQSGYYSVKEVAEKAGFSDSKYFSRLFKSKKKLPPSKTL